MQVTDADPEHCRRVGVDEKFIHFRSSPNFKNMKKYIKSKIGNEEPCLNQSPLYVTAEASPPLNNIEYRENSPNKNKVIQPPLPLHPPPPDSPPNLVLTLKKEIEEVEEDINQSMNEEELITQFKTDKSDETPDKTKPAKPIICRDYIRGTCTRPGTCRFSHEFDISQLPGVYTFCRNFQNSKCTFPTCKYVHATVFEEQRFYRTGKLPPHALSHHKKVNLLPPPPPPPPEDLNKTDVAPNFSNPPPHCPVGMDKTIPIINCIPAANMDTRQVTIVTSPLKNWCDLEQINGSPRDFDGNDKLGKKCKNCELTEFRLEYNKDIVDKMLRTSQTNTQRLNQMNKKNHKLFTVLLTLLKQNAKTGITNGVSSNQINLGGEKEKLMEQLSEYLNANRAAVEDK